jgi:transcriptional regulator with GAF, ATPase, and Fis domain
VPDDANTVDIGRAAAEGAPASGAARSFLSLLVSSASGVSVVPIGSAKTVSIGRSATCDVAIADDSVSRKHAVLRVTPACTIEDLGSRNGTMVQGRRIEPGLATPVGPGACIELGSATVVLVRARPVTVDTKPEAPSSDDAAPSAGLVVRDPAMLRLLAMLDVIAPSELTVLLQGETGVGKELFATEVHTRSLRHSGPFLTINCAALPESTLEAELFGHEKGAFTGAVAAKPGLFEAAEGGTLFLDEIAELPRSVQAKLLRVVENREVLRMGSVKPRVIDVRLVTATNRDLAALSEAGQFRADLFYRLNGVTLTLPPLRQRRGDIAPLATHFLERACARQGRPALRLSGDAASALEAHEWPGNVRELRLAMERAAVLCRDAELSAVHLALPQKGQPAAAAPTVARPAPSNLREQVESFEKQRVIDALDRSSGNQTRAAKLLGVSRGTLIAKIQAYGIERPRKR